MKFCKLLFFNAASGLAIACTEVTHLAQRIWRAVCQQGLGLTSGGFMKKFSALIGISALVFLGFALAPAAHAGIVSLTLSSTGADTTFTISGTYAAGVPSVSDLAAPNDPYSMSFTLDTLASSNSGFSSSPGNGFQVNTDFSFSLNGGVASSLGPITVFFYTNTGGNVGGLGFCLDSSCDTYWTIAGQVLFSGSVSNPTFGLPGLGNGQTMNASVNPNPIYTDYEVDGQGPFPFITPTTTTPEPASLLLLGTGLFGLGIILRRRLKLT